MNCGIFASIVAIVKIWAKEENPWAKMIECSTVHIILPNNWGSDKIEKNIYFMVQGESR